MYTYLTIKPLIYGDCRWLSLINDDHPLLQRQRSIFRAARYRSAVCPYGLCRRGEQGPRLPGQGHDITGGLMLVILLIYIFYDKCIVMWNLCTVCPMAVIAKTRKEVKCVF
jgi:hypothetical protein